MDQWLVPAVTAFWIGFVSGQLFAWWNVRRTFKTTLSDIERRGSTR